jgi:hypothetical protein
MTLLCKKITVAKSKEVKTRSNLTESSKEGYSSKRAVLPMMMIVMGWMARVLFLAGGRDFYFFLLHSIQTGSGAHSASCLVGTGAHSLGLKWRRREADTQLHLVLRARMVELYLHSPIRLHGVLIN